MTKYIAIDMHFQSRIIFNDAGKLDEVSAQVGTVSSSSSPFQDIDILL